MTLIQDYIWTYLLIAVLIGCAIWFTVRTRFVQFSMIGEMFRLLTDSSNVHEKGQKHISSFQAFAVGVATRVGTGNMAGVAIAISVGGAGSVFWMWLIALLGSATAFVESTLAQLYKTHGTTSFIGGPAYYMKKGLHLPWMGSLFAVLITITFGLSYNSIQSNTICSAMEKAFGWNPLLVGIVIAAMGIAIVFGGIQRIAKVSSVLVPIMAIGYVVLALYVIGTNLSLVPDMFRHIFSQAFGWEQVGGGTLGAVLMTGIKRGLFSNEAGEGSAPNAAATASVSHPVKQGLIQALGVFTDTLLICSCTAFIILLSGIYETSATDGIVLTQAALESEVGSMGVVFVALAILCFAFSSIIGNYYYGEANIHYLTQKKWIMTTYRLMSAGVVVLFGAVASLQLVWSIGDLCMALLTICNLIAIILLGKYAFRLLDDYRKQKKEGKEPVFNKATLPEIAKDLECWD
ncbi:MAG: alanine:cation symporter family protein [Bacteroidaceae bacterium]|nr:alanine:cation symporter family protein [Bacteroidaceae bacterium]